MAYYKFALALGQHKSKSEVWHAILRTFFILCFTLAFAQYKGKTSKYKGEMLYKIPCAKNSDRWNFSLKAMSCLDLACIIIVTSGHPYKSKSGRRSTASVSQIQNHFHYSNPDKWQIAPKLCSILTHESISQFGRSGHRGVNSSSLSCSGGLHYIQHSGLISAPPADLMVMGGALVWLTCNDVLIYSTPWDF